MQQRGGQVRPAPNLKAPEGIEPSQPPPGVRKQPIDLPPGVQRSKGKIECCFSVTGHEEAAVVGASRLNRAEPNLGIPLLFPCPQEKNIRYSIPVEEN
jgi:hypothetical protein